MNRASALCVVAIFFLVLLLLFTEGPDINAAGVGSQVVVSNSAPTVSSVIVNGGSPITLTANQTTTVQVSFTVQDQNGCSDVFVGGRVTSTLHRSGLASTCKLEYANCYRRTTTTYSCVGTSTTAQATSTFEIYYFADATDASSSYPSQSWMATIDIRDSLPSTSTATSTGQDINTLLAIQPTTSTIAYGLLNPNTNTSGTNQILDLYNAGNASSGLNLNGTALLFGGNSIGTSSQHYSTSSFTYGGAEQALQETATLVAGYLIHPVPFGRWTDTTPLPTAVGMHTMGTWKNYIYSAGGYNGSVSTATVRFASISPTGTIGTWTNTTPLPYTVDDHASVIINGYIYVIGGWAAGTGDSTSTVLFAPINSTGSVGAWIETTPLPQKRTEMTAVTWNNYLYALGGRFSGGANQEQSEVYFTLPSATGSIPNWTSTTPIPTINGMSEHASAVWNGYIYAMGGSVSFLNDAAEVYFAPITATSAVGTWSSTISFSTERFGLSAFAWNGILYATGGYINEQTNVTTTITYSPIKPNGSLVGWVENATPLSYAAQQAPFSLWNGHLYYAGGITPGTTYTSTIARQELPNHETYWGIDVPNGTATGTYTGTNTFTAVFLP